jgi:hypothetical protein
MLVAAYERSLRGEPLITYVTSGMSDERVQSLGMANAGLAGVRVEYVLYARRISEDHVALLRWAADHRNVWPGNLFSFMNRERNPLRENQALDYVLLWNELPIGSDAETEVAVDGDQVRFLTLVLFYEEEARRLWDAGADRNAHLAALARRHPMFWLVDPARAPFAALP